MTEYNRYTGIIIFAALAGCGTALTDGTFTGLATQPNQSSGSGSSGPTTDGNHPSSNIAVAPVARNVTCDINGLSPTYLVAHYSNLLPQMRLVIATATPTAGVPVNSVTIDNFLNGNTSLPAGASTTVSLSGNNSPPAPCDVCMTATRQTDNVGTYRVISGSILIDTPANPGGTMSVRFDDVKLEMTQNGSTVHWCINQVTAGANTKSWNCNDLNASRQPTCWKSPDGVNMGALICNVNDQPTMQACSTTVQVCGDAANNPNVHSLCH